MTIPLLREARASDLAGLLGLSRSAGAGITTLPPDAGHLSERLRRAEISFGSSPARPGDDDFLFVVEDERGRLVATAAVMSRVGGFDPFYTYEVRPERVTHPPLGVDRTFDVLHLTREHKGPSELCGLLVAPDLRGRGIGALASIGRLLFVAAHLGSFADRTIAEIRGFQDSAGRSPFWEAVGRVFLSPNGFAEADRLTGLGEKDFVADLMPRHPIYLDLLSEEVRAVVGRAHHDAEPALRILVDEGFVRSCEVDIFDAGPIVECRTADIRSVRSAVRAPLAGRGEVAGSTSHLVAAVGPPFRAVRCPARVGGDGLVVPGEAATRLGVQPGDDLVAVTTGGGHG